MTDRKELRAKVEACPTIGGSQTGFGIEWRPDSDSKWRTVPTVETFDGVPDGSLGRHISHAVGLRGMEQAMALAWAHLAQLRASNQFAAEVRVVPYDMEYNIKTWKDEGAALVLPNFFAPLKEPKP